MKSLSKIQKGFTLIELLIVIAVLGVLAAVVLVAIDPIQQLARTEDAGRKSSVAQLGHALQAYYTAQNATFIAESGTWQTSLVSAGEIAQAITQPTNSKGNCSNNAHNNYCYETNGTDAIVWSVLESKADTIRGGGTCATTPTHYAVAVWVASQGKAGVGCLGASATTIPPYTITLN